MRKWKKSRLHWHKKTEFFSHSGFSLEVARQLPLNTAKNPNEKPTSEVWFFETPPVFHWFFANVNACSPLTGIIRVFSHVGRDLPRNHPRPGTYYTAHYVRSKVERSRACAPLTKNTVWDSGLFANALFLQKTRKVMGFSGSVNGTTKTQVLGILVFANVNGPKDTSWTECPWHVLVRIYYSKKVAWDDLCGCVIYTPGSQVQEN